MEISLIYDNQEKRVEVEWGQGEERNITCSAFSRPAGDGNHGDSATQSNILKCIVARRILGLY
jgi:hypothetical protein